MKININRIPPEGLKIQESLLPQSLDLDSDMVKFKEPLNVRGLVSKSDNVINADLDLSIKGILVCSRCLNEIIFDVNKKARFNYPVDPYNPIIDLDQDIREEIIIDYPIKPLCAPDCKGLCIKCGESLNTGKCKCC